MHWSWRPARRSRRLPTIQQRSQKADSSNAPSSPHAATMTLQRASSSSAASVPGPTGSANEQSSVPQVTLTPKSQRDLETPVTPHTGAGDEALDVGDRLGSTTELRRQQHDAKTALAMRRILDRNVDPVTQDDVTCRLGERG